MCVREREGERENEKERKSIEGRAKREKKEFSKESERGIRQEVRKGELLKKGETERVKERKTTPFQRRY